MGKIRAGIIGLGTYVPADVLTNSDLEKLVNTSDEWITSRTGIKERRIIDKNQAASDIGAIAAAKAIDESGLNPEDIELIICTSLSPDMIAPSTATIIQHKIKAKNAAAFDVSSACAGFSFGLSVGTQFIENGTYNNVLLIGTEAISRFIDYSDRKTCILFGDGAGAVVLAKVEEPYGIVANYLGADGNRHEHIRIPAGGSSVPASEETVLNGEHFLKMNGNEVFKFAVRVIPQAIDNVLQIAGLKKEDIDLFIPHQANKRIIDSAIEKAGIDENKVFINLDKYGNTSTASVPLALGEARENGLLKKGDLTLLIGFGAGLSWGANIVCWAL
ncbi:MAG: ketoacyl-ACP synthase III [Actinobacteria bacterium]|nr:MAG: ketoacyl-ACP synthase III [Actinomycetota bacterium]